MEPAALLPALVELAESLDISVQRIRGGFESDGPTASGVCTLRGRVWVMLSDSDPLPRRIELLAAALRDHGGSELEERYLPPALRRCLELDSEGA